MTAQQEQKPGDISPPETPPSAPSIVEGTPSQSITPAPSPPVPSAEDKEKVEKQAKEEKVKKARALLDQTVKFIAKRENLPENLVRMELYLENRMRKTTHPKLDRIEASLREVNHSLGALGSLLMKSVNATSSEVGMQEEQYPDVVEPVIASIVEAPPSPPPFDEVANQNDPLFGSALLYLVGGS